MFWRVNRWCQRQAFAFLTSVLLAGILNGDSSEALTTFGKSNTQPPKPVITPPPPPACSSQKQCSGISGTSCVRTHYESTTRCLCGDNLPPFNGKCEAQTKTLYHMCSNSDECNDGLICGTPNMTIPPPEHLRVLSPGDKICLCDNDSGYREVEHACSDADILQTSILAILVVSWFRKLL